MSQLTTLLKSRIQELNAHIDAQKTQLAAYERILDLETGQGSAPTTEITHKTVAPPKAAPTKSAAKKKSASAKKTTPTAAPKRVAVAASNDSAKTPFVGNKTALVADIVKSHGSGGASPKDVDAVFTARKIQRSKNLIYNTLSYLVAEKRLERKDGKYYAVAAAPLPTTVKTAATPNPNGKPTSSTKKPSPTGALKKP